jgi:hypothetical protein
MYEIGARLLARGVVGALIAGFVDVFAAFLILSRSASDLSEWWRWNAWGLAAGTTVESLVFAPLTMLLLPLTWLAFKRSRYRAVALLAMGVLGGVVWQLKLPTLSSELSVGPWLGAVSGLGAASCFLGLSPTASTSAGAAAPGREPRDG